MEDSTFIFIDLYLVLRFCRISSADTRKRVGRLELLLCPYLDEDKSVPYFRNQAEAWPETYPGSENLLMIQSLCFHFGIPRALTTVHKSQQVLGGDMICYRAESYRGRVSVCYGCNTTIELSQGSAN